MRALGHARYVVGLLLVLSCQDARRSIPHRAVPHLSPRCVIPAATLPDYTSFPEWINPHTCGGSTSQHSCWRSPMRTTLKNQTVRAVLALRISGAALTLTACDVPTNPNGP